MEKMSKARLNNFNILRLVGAIMVMAGHMGFISGTSVPILWGQGIQTLGVKIFFLIGGYLIAKSWLADSNPLRYGIKRVMRIFPPLIVCVFCMAYIVGPLVTNLPLKEYFSNPQVLTYFIRNILLFPIYSLPGVFENLPYPNAVNGSLWTLPVEFAMYILVPFILLLVSAKRKDKKSQVYLTALTIIICVFQVAHLRFFPEWRYVIWGTDVAQAFSLIPYYFIGMLFVFPNLKKILNIQAAVILALLYSCLNLNPAMNELGTYIVFPYLIFSIAFAEKPYFASVFSKHEISYGIYLYSFCIQQLVVYLFTLKGIALGFLGYLMISMSITCLCAYVSCRLVEEPMQRVCKNILLRCRAKKIQNREQ